MLSWVANNKHIWFWGDFFWRIVWQNCHRFKLFQLNQAEGFGEKSWDENPDKLCLALCIYAGFGRRMLSIKMVRAEGWVKKGANTLLSWGSPLPQHCVGINRLFTKCSSGIAIVGLYGRPAQIFLSLQNIKWKHTSKSHKRILASLDFVQNFLKDTGQYFWKMINNSGCFQQVKLGQCWDIVAMDILWAA